jgi:hypothetical protein
MTRTRAALWASMAQPDDGITTDAQVARFAAQHAGVNLKAIGGDALARDRMTDAQAEIVAGVLLDCLERCGEVLDSRTIAESMQQESEIDRQRADPMTTRAARADEQWEREARR